MSKTRRAFVARAEVLWAAGFAVAAGAAAISIAGLPTNLDDFFGPGTQPNQSQSNPLSRARAPDSRT